MKILHITPHYWPPMGPDDTVIPLRGLCRSLAERGHEVHVYTSNRDGSDLLKVPTGKPMEHDGVVVSYFSSPNLLGQYFQSPAMAETVRQNIKQFDIVHIHTCFTWPAIMASRIAAKAGIPYIFSPQNMLEKSLFSGRNAIIKWLWFYLFGKKILRQASYIHLTSRREDRELAKFYQKSVAIKIIANGVSPPDKISNVEQLLLQPWQNKDYVLAMGDICWKNGLNRLISAWSYKIDVPLVIAGTDDETTTANIFAQADKDGVADSIHFIGPAHGQKKWSLLNNASLLVIPSHSEGFGNLVLEAMAAGCPVITRAEIGAASILEEAKAGLVVSGGPKQLAQSINEILTDHSWRQAMGRRGVEHVQRYYTWPTIAESMEGLYVEAKLKRKTRHGKS
ncbi:MAG: glycosyltransferase [Magnetococcales bacterium]|nr:glycosyltransferase [Magnetococcales bacterium]